MSAEIDQIEALAAALSEKVGRREMSLADFEKSYGFLRADLQPLVAERERINAAGSRALPGRCRAWMWPGTGTG